MQNSSIKKNQIYKLGNHILACGDCTDGRLVSFLLENIRVNLILTDPPYGVSYVESKNDLGVTTTINKKIANDSLNTGAYYSFTKSWLELVRDRLSNKNTYYIFNGDKMLFSLHEALIDCDFKFSQLLIWIKSQPVLGRKDYMPQHELIVYGWFGTHAFKKSKDRSLLFYPRPQKNKLHPTMKPIGLLRRLILNSSSIGDVVYDPFAGSGSTLIACEHTKRVCVCIEQDPKYCKTIIERFKKLTGLDAELLKDLNV